MTHSTLGLDCSSVCIGHAFVDDVGCDHGRIVLEETKRDPIGLKLDRAYRETKRLLDLYKPALVSIEDVAFTHKSGGIPQVLVRGVILLALHERQALYIEPTPGSGKKLLTGSGDAGIKQAPGVKKDVTRRLRKQAMIAAACDAIGYHYKNIAVVRGVLSAIDGNDVLMTEDEADAYAVALVGRAQRVMETTI